MIAGAVYNPPIQNREDLPMDFRREIKYEISRTDMLLLRQRLGVIMRPDEHAVNGSYLVRSLYFDDPADRALREKLDGVSRREKFRLRYYNGDARFLRLEKKSKLAGLCGKQTALLSARDAQAIADGDWDWMARDGRPLVRELYVKMRTRLLRPKTVVDYTREPFVYPPGNVRATLDHDIRTGLSRTDFLNPGCVTIPAGDTVILEVKWDGFLPDIIRDAIQLPDRRAGAFSKYAQCRIYG